MIFLLQALIALVNFDVDADVDVDVDIDVASRDESAHLVPLRTKKVTQTAEIQSTEAGGAGLTMIVTLRDGEQAA